MRRVSFALLILISLLTASCQTGTPAPTPVVITVHSTSAAEPWLAALYDCAGASPVLSRIDDPNSAQIALRVGEPKKLAFGYQIDTEEVLVVTQRQSPVQNLTLEEARALFMGLGDPSLQVWVYAAGADVQEVFDQFVMEGRSITPSAHIAVTAQQMSDTLVNEPGTVGILPKHWKAGDSRAVYTIPNVPVLAVTQNEPQGEIKRLIACLQR